jgi:hypothetical protein
MELSVFVLVSVESVRSAGSLSGDRTEYDKRFKNLVTCPQNNLTGVSETKLMVHHRHVVAEMGTSWKRLWSETTLRPQPN